MSDLSVSVVITAYNRESLIETAVRSALHQTYAVREVIVVDDASTDGTRQVVSAIEDPRVSLVCLDENHGHSFACNTGIDRAGGDYVAFLDSDDAWEPFKIEDQVAQAVKRGPGYLIYCPVRYVHRNGRETIAPTREVRGGESIGDYLFVNGGFMQTSTLFLETQIARDVRFDERMSHHTDHCFVLALEAAGVRFAMTERPGTFWHTIATNRMSTSTAGGDDLAFVQACRDRLRFRARCGFRAKSLAPHIWRTQPLRAALHIALGIMFGGVSVRKLLSRLWGEVFGHEGQRQL